MTDKTVNSAHAYKLASQGMCVGDQSKIDHILYLENFIQNDDKIYFIKTSENTNILKCNNRSKDRL